MMVKITPDLGEKHAYHRVKIKIYSRTHFLYIVQYLNANYGHGKTAWRISHRLRNRRGWFSRKFKTPAVKTLLINEELIGDLDDAKGLAIFLSLLPET